MKLINYNHLYYFQVIAKEGSIQKASKILHLTQPTLSEQLKNLEEYLGIKLFERRNRKLVLNDAGKKALDYANQIFSLGKELEKSVHQVKSQKKRYPIKIGVVPYLSKIFTFDLFFPFFQIEQFEIKIKEADMQNLIYDLILGHLDLVLSTSKVAAYQKGFKSTPIKKSKYYAVIGKEFKLPQKPFPEILNNLPFFHYTDDSPIKTEIDLYFKNSQLTPYVVGEADDVNFLKIATKKNLCFTILPEASLKNLNENNKNDFISLGLIEELTSSVWIIHKENEPSSELFNFIQDLKSQHIFE